MLEERLSKAYSQQSLGGYNAPPPRQSAYPSLPSHAPGNPGAAENFYGAQHRASYHAPPTQRYQQHPQPDTSSPYPYGAPRDGTPAQYASQPHLQRTESWQQSHQGPQDPAQHRQTPQQVAATPAPDPHTSYYFGNQAPQASQAPQAQQAPQAPSAPGVSPEDTTSPYPNLPQSRPYHQGSVSAQSQPTPVQTPTQPPNPPQPSQPIQQPQIAQQAPQQPLQHQPSQPQQPYWQQQAPPPQQPQQAQHQQQPPAAAQQPWAYNNAYQQPQFPSVPQNEPIRKPVQEEALIEL